MGAEAGPGIGEGLSALVNPVRGLRRGCRCCVCAGDVGDLDGSEDGGHGWVCERSRECSPEEGKAEGRQLCRQTYAR